MIEYDKLRDDVLSAAYDDVLAFFREFLPEGGPRFVTSSDWAHSFAYIIADAPPQVFAQSFPKKEYGSWLAVLDRSDPVNPVAAIAINEGKLIEWEETPPGRVPVPAVLQEARAILHEVGHIHLHPHLLRDDAPAPPYTPEAARREEEEAWVYAFVTLAVLLGDYAYFMRVTKDMDNTPGVGV